MPGTTTKFHCPTYGAEYLLVRVEAPPTHEDELLCLGCGGPLQGREGKFALKYFRVDAGQGRRTRNGQKPKF